MRELPGMVFAQSGARGSVADLFVRGGDSNYNLVELNGIPINSFYYGGGFDFSQIASDFISEVDVARGPQSAVNGSYAIGSVVDSVKNIATSAIHTFTSILGIGSPSKVMADHGKNMIDGLILGITGSLPGLTAAQTKVAATLMQIFTSAGLTKSGAAAIVGNWVQESSLNPNEPGGLLGQWQGSRLTNEHAYAAKHHEAGDHVEAGHHAHLATGHDHHADHHASEAAKAHTKDHADH